MSLPIPFPMPENATIIEAAVQRASEMIAAGADLLDIGGESTRPGAEPVPVDLELERVIPGH